MSARRLTAALRRRRKVIHHRENFKNKFYLYSIITHSTAKRYMRQLTEYGHLEALGGNRNRTYRVRKPE